jgi:hypothetical protein
MHNDFLTLDLAVLHSITGGEGETQGPNQERAQLGVQVKGVNVGATVERTRTDYAKCLDTLRPDQSARQECGLPGGGQ